MGANARRHDESDEIDRTGEAARLREKGRQRRATHCRPNSSRFHLHHFRRFGFQRAPSALECSKGGESDMTFTDMVTYFRARFGVEEGQTMAEYGVVLAVITALVVAAILALSGAIAGALNKVQTYL
jgi:Flp pilus assembly pilin Flp